MGVNKLAIIVSSCILFVALVGVICVTFTTEPYETDDGSFRTSSKSENVKSICEPTDYKDTCEKALQSIAKDTDDPKELVKAAFTVTIRHVEQVFNQSSFVEDASKDKRTADAIRNCEQLLDMAAEQLKNSFDKLDLDMSKIGMAIDDLKVWLSASITYQETCLDGFEHTTTGTGEKMRKALNTSQELTSNALAIITELGDLLSTADGKELLDGTGSRRLLASGAEPAWFSPSKRRLLEMSPLQLHPNVTVAKDGSGDYATINDALLKVPENSHNVFIIYIKEGVYHEKVEVGRTMRNVMMVGDGPTKTKITGSLNWIDGVPTLNTSTVSVLGDYFMAKDLGIENAAGAIKEQAVALHVQSDMSVFYNCRFDGYQDTLYSHTMRQFYRDCTITGTIDFIFGNAPSVFQNCLILFRQPLANQQNIITASGRKDNREPTAIILHNCTITADPSFAPNAMKFQNYLGRPWKEYSRTFFIQSHLDELVHPDGWMPWIKDWGLKTCFYAEVDNRGPGSDMSRRVTWEGIKNVSYADATSMFTVDKFLQGTNWLPKTGVPFIAGMLPQGYMSSGTPKFATLATPTLAPAPAPTLAPKVAPRATPTTAPTLVPTSAPALIHSSAPASVPASAPTTPVPISVPTKASTTAPSMALASARS